MVILQDNREPVNSLSPATARDALLNSALQVAELGWRVIPLHDVSRGTCSCGNPDCKSQGKHPRCLHGLKDGAIDAEEIRRWWTHWPMANVGVCTGEASGVWMLGPDGPAGIEALAELQRRYGALPPTPAARSGSGGRHYYFRWPPEGNIINRRNHRGLPIDVRGTGGYFVAAPSRNKNGLYEWEFRPDEWKLADAPAWLLAWVRDDGKAASPPPTAPPRNGTSVEERAIKYLDKMPPAISGQGGHDQTMEAARIVVYGFGLGAERGYQLLAAHYNPRCVPPWSERELRHKAAEADMVPFGKPRGWLLDERPAPPAQPPAIEPAVTAEQLTRAMLETLRARPPLARTLLQILRDIEPEE